MDHAQWFRGFTRLCDDKRFSICNEVTRLDKKVDTEAFGPNSWLVDEMYQQYQENPMSVGEQWQEFFEDYRPVTPQPATRPKRETPPPAAQAPPPTKTR